MIRQANFKEMKMNTVIKQLLSRKSVRNFTGERVNGEDLELIFRAAQQAPTSIGGQQVSLVYTRDKEKINKIAEIAGGQPQVATADVFITIVIDFNRTNEACILRSKQQVIHASAEGLLAGAGDAGIMLNALQTAANALGYGSTAIGGIRNNPQAMIELLDLPKKTFPILGITLGVADLGKTIKVRPRVPLHSFAMEDIYDKKAVRKGVEAYDKTIRTWWDEQGLTNMPNYSDQTAIFYQRIYFSTVAKTLEEQGFAFKDK